MELSEEQVSEFLAAPKLAYGPVKWQARLDAASWQEFRIPVAFKSDSGVKLEGTFIQCACKKAAAPKSSVLSLNLIYAGKLVFAVHVQPDDKHKNKVGKGKPYYNQFISGIHKHIWTQEGQGYAEPLDFTGVADYADAWALFLREAGIEFEGDFHVPATLLQDELEF